MAQAPAKYSLGVHLPTDKYPLLVRVIQLIAEGETETEACAQIGLAITTFRRTMKQDVELQELYAEATKVGNDVLADKLINIDKVNSLPAMASVLSRNIMWLLERRNPDKYGARVTLVNENRASMLVIEALHKAMDRIPKPAALPAPALAATDVTYEIVDPLPQKKTAPLAETPSDTQLEETLRQLGLA